MKSDIRTFVHSAVAAASKRPAATTEPNRNQMFRFKAAYLLVLMGLVAPMQSFAAAPGPAPYCIAVGGGFGNGGSTFVARNFSMPEANKCTPWTGYTKTSATVIFTTNGTACLSGDSPLCRGPADHGRRRLVSPEDRPQGPHCPTGVQ